MNKAVFLDRDGVINSDVGHYYIFKPADFVLNKGVIEALKSMQDAGYLLIVISNQGGVSKGLYSKHDVNLVHHKLQGLLGEHGIELKEIYFCPHHNSFQNCLCRKPNSLNIEKALARFNINREESYFIGDNHSDIEAAHKAGVIGIKIDANQNILTVINQIIHE